MKVFVAGATGVLGRAARPPARGARPRRGRDDQERVEAGSGAQPRGAAGGGRRARSRRGRPGGGVRRAGGDRAPAHGAVGRLRHAPHRPLLREARTGCARRAPTTCSPPPRGRRAAVRGAELRGLAARAHRRAREGRGRAVRSRPAGAAPRHDGRHPPRGGGGDRRRIGARASCCATAGSTGPAPP